MLNSNCDTLNNNLKERMPLTLGTAITSGDILTLEEGVYYAYNVSPSNFNNLPEMIASRDTSYFTVTVKTGTRNGQRKFILEDFASSYIYVTIVYDKTVNNGWHQIISDDALSTIISNLGTSLDTSWTTSVTITASLHSGAHALLSISGNLYLLVTTSGNLGYNEIIFNNEGGLSLSFSTVGRTLTINSTKNVLIGIIPFNGKFIIN